MQLKNEFSWSKSRDEVFKECKRKYYFDKYGSWNGWNAGAGERTKKLYQLKKLSTRQVWLGKIIHEAIEHFLTELKAGNHLPLNTLLLLLNQELRSRYQSSEAGLYRTFHKKGGLIEHEHNKVITKEEKEELFKLAEKCVRNFYNSEVLKEIKSLDVAKWLSLEEFLSFDFEGIKIFLSMDFVIKNGDNKIIIYDWKTGKDRDTEIGIQLACYALYVIQKWGLDPSKVIVKRCHLALDKEDEFFIDEKVIEQTKEYIRKSVVDMQNMLTDKENNLAEENKFPQTEDRRKCLRCNFRRVCNLV